jgi:hypothetical protein
VKPTDYQREKKMEAHYRHPREEGEKGKLTSSGGFEQVEIEGNLKDGIFSGWRSACQRQAGRMEVAAPHPRMRHV